MDSPDDRARPAQEQSRFMTGYQFSPEEAKVLQECNSESFWQRSLPLAISFGTVTHFLIKTGRSKAHPKYGVMPKMFVSVAIGYLVGKFSYQGICAEKLMKLPNSRLGEVLRQRRMAAGGGFSRPDQDLSRAMTFGTYGSEIYSDEHLQPGRRGNALDLDTESRSTVLDDFYRPTPDEPQSSNEEDLPTVKPGTTYEELRKRNREAYSKKQQALAGNRLPSEQPSSSNSPEDNETTSTAQPRRNKYGDVWQN